MRILFSSMRLTGHMRPLFPYAKEAQRRGHEVRFAAPESARGLAEKEGFAFSAFDHPGDERLEHVWQRCETLPLEWANALYVGDIFAGMNAVAALPTLRALMADWKPELVVRESGEFGAMVAAAEAQVPVAHVTVNNDVAEEWVFDHVRARVDLLRVSVGLKPDNGAAMRAAPAFTSFPKALSSTEEVAKGRAPFRVRTERYAPPPSLRDNAGGRPLIYISLGTLPGAASAGADVYRAAVAAASDIPADFVLSTGGAVLEDGCLGSIPGNVTVREWVNPGDIFPKATALHCHGGSGTLLEGLASGLPMVLTPLHADQPDNAALVEKSGAGVMVGDKTAASIRDGYIRLVTDRDLSARAEAISDEIAAMPGIEEAVDAMLGAV